ncbi:hypothetical protein J6590_108806 [Homalodisca vitripennis]|nr:hypothetical protein J6590_108777 [Homalodisca vitripennis]KAG8286338.1 hypothetical protein J6590_108806 [Homalodisca vitripennis]
MEVELKHKGIKGKNGDKVKNENKGRKKKHVSPYNWGRQFENPKKYEDAKFTESFGPKFDSGTTPIKSFSLFLDQDILMHIVSQSNLYANQSNNFNLNLTVDELKCFLGILIIMGFHKLPSIRLYWSTDPNFHFSRISKLMSLKRFLKILRFLHLNDNEKLPDKGSPDFDKLFKIRPLLDYVNNKCQTMFQPSRNLSVDESMIGFKGRNTMKQYMPKKPVKRGFKVWAIACSQTGFVCSIEVYTGAKGGNPELLLGEKVVMGMCSLFLKKNYCVHFDNFFSTVPLVEKLLENGVFACGTFRSDRKHYPTNLSSDKAMEQGQYDAVQFGDLSVCKWKDHGKKSVSVLSNYHNPSKVVKVLRGDSTGTRKLVDCPVSISDYNQNMGGVDRFDQLLATYNITWKSRRWWLKFFYYLVDLSIVNSFVSYKALCKANKVKPLSHLMYRSELANDLIGDFSSKQRPGPPIGTSWGRKRNRSDGYMTVPNKVRLTGVGEHVPVVGTYRRCAYCSTKEKQKRSNLQCKKCDVGLCKGCFSLFHST